MASNAFSQEEENYVRMSLLLTGISPRAVHVLFDKEFPPASLSLTVNDKKVKKKLNDLRGKRVINQAQWDLLFPTSGITDSKTFDLTLMIALLRNLTTLTSPINGYDNLPVTTETTPASDLARIKHYRNILAHLDDAKVDGTLFTTAWKDISGAVFRLGGNAMKKECDQLMTKPLDMSSHETLREVQQAKKEIESIKQSLDLIKTDMKTFKSSHDSLKESCDLLQVEQTESRADIVVLKSDHQNLKKSHDLLQNEQTVSKMDRERVRKDVNTLKLNHTSLENSQGLLQNDQREVRIDVQNIKSDCEILKTSQDLLQSDQIKTKEDVKKLTSLSEDTVPWNRRVMFCMEGRLS